MSSAGATPYNYFTRLADAFVHGRYYLIDNPPWLSELIPLGSGNFTFPYPPGPAILLIPFIIVFGQNFPQQLFAHLVGAGITLVASLICFEITKNKAKTVWFAVLVATGNILWYMSSVGSVWLLGQTTAVLFTLLAILALLKNKNPILIGILLGIAFLSRIEMIVILPFFWFLSKKEDRLKLLTCFLFFVELYGLYNYIRFGSLTETGYSLIPGILSEPWYSKGIINPIYILNNLKVMFASFPGFIRSFPFLIPSWGGLAIWITSPVFIYALFADFKEKIAKLSTFSIVSILLVVTMHGETGYTQFGYRFAADTYPFIFLLIAKSISKRNLKLSTWVILVISVLVNAWGVILINKLNIVAP